MGEKCHKCGIEIKADEPFILEGGYPSLGGKIFKPMALRHMQLAWYGNLYHKKCYNSLKGSKK